MAAVLCDCQQDLAPPSTSTKLSAVVSSLGRSLQRLGGGEGGQMGQRPGKGFPVPFTSLVDLHVLFVSLKLRPPSCFQQLGGVLLGHWWGGDATSPLKPWGGE